jgi:hypothetical protein
MTLTSVITSIITSDIPGVRTPYAVLNSTQEIEVHKLNQALEIGARYQNAEALLAYPSIWHQDEKSSRSVDQDKPLM